MPQQEKTPKSDRENGKLPAPVLKARNEMRRAGEGEKG
jgi:hypothetical protein